MLVTPISKHEYLLGEGSEICRAFSVAVLTLFHQWQKLLGHVQSRSLGIVVTPAVWLILISLLFIFVSSCLCVYLRFARL